MMTRKNFEVGPRNHQELIAITLGGDGAQFTGLIIDKFYVDPEDPGKEQPHVQLMLSADQVRWLKEQVKDLL